MNVRRAGLRRNLLRVLLAASLTAGLTQAQRAGVHATVATEAIRGPYAALLSGSVDLGPSSAGHTQLTAELKNGEPPDRLAEWARRKSLSVKWRVGDTWAVVEGTPTAMAKALRVDIHDYRHPIGKVFYASAQQAMVPTDLAGEVAGFGRIMSYSPHTWARPWPLPREVPDRGLSPDALMRAYHALPLVSDGATGRGITVVVFAFDGFDQADLDMHSTAFGLPRFTPEVVGGMPPDRRGEATMDLEAIHAIAPEARTILVNAGSTVAGEGAYLKVAAMMEDVHRRFPGAVWSLSIGWGCDRLVTAADLAPIRSALTLAHRSGTTAFDASGDLAGLECKFNRDWSAAPGPDDVGLDAVASLPEITAVGGTTLSTDSDGGWVAERAWFDVPLSQGSGGGVSALFDRPAWQRVDPPGAQAGRRLIPDVAAVADQFTGLKVVFNQQFGLGGGTSLAAPIWAGLTALMDDLLLRHGGTRIGDLNPLLYRIAADAPRPAFRDIVTGGNAVAMAVPGYDMVTGMGTPDAENLVADLYVDQKLGG